jgi:DNA repair exonuclease SbcCD ATPase subunit
MLNIHSKEGEISLIFSADEQYYLIRRFLKPGKSKDSCSSQLFTISFQGNDILKTLKNPIFYPPARGEANEVSGGLLNSGEVDGGFQGGGLMRHTNIIATLSSHPDTFQLEEIVLKNETDLQQQLDQLLPPKSVFLSTMFLLQDAENIFEMQPADRLTVLKNVFGLLGIDEAKEQVQDKKREISYKLKALQDQSQQDNKLRKRLKSLHENYNTIKKSDFLSPCQGGNDPERSEGERGVVNTTNTDTFFTELEPFLDQLTLNDFTLNGLDTQIFIDKQHHLQEKEKSLLALQTSKDHLTKHITDHQTQIQKRNNEHTKLQSEISLLEQKIARIDTNQIEKLKKEKADLYHQQEQLETNIPTEKIEKFFNFYPLLGGSPEGRGG